MQVLNSPLWTPFGVVVAIIIGVLSLRPTKRKVLTYQAVANLPLATLSNSDKQLGEIDLRYLGAHVPNARIVVVRLWNSGNTPIDRADFDKPIRLKYSGKLLMSVVSEATPDHLRDDAQATVDTGQDESAAQLRPVLLNPGDSLTLTALVADSLGDFEVQAHINGARLERFDDTLRSHVQANKLVITLFVVAVLVELNDVRLDIQYRSPTGIAQDALYLFFFIYAAALIVYRSWSSRQDLYLSTVASRRNASSGLV